MQNIKYLAAAAGLAAVSEAQGIPPHEYACTIAANMMPQVSATIQGLGPFQMNIETNSNNNMAFTSTCTQQIDAL